MTILLIIGHRGAAALMPENTLESMRLAFDQFKVDGIEFDVHLTQDQVPVIIHDAKAERTTNGLGYISKLKLADLKKLNAAQHFKPAPNTSSPYRNQVLGIPTFEELLKEFPTQNLLVEIKPKDRLLVQKVMTLIQKYNAESRVIVGSQHHDVYDEMKNNFPETPRFLSQREIVLAYLDYQRGNPSPEQNRLSVASMPLEKCGMHFASKGFIDFLHRKKIRAFYWTINDPEVMRVLAGSGADGLITDNPAIANEVFYPPTRNA